MSKERMRKQVSSSDSFNQYELFFPHLLCSLLSIYITGNVLLTGKRSASVGMPDLAVLERREQGTQRYCLYPNFIHGEVPVWQTLGIHSPI